MMNRLPAITCAVFFMVFSLISREAPDFEDGLVLVSIAFIVSVIIKYTIKKGNTAKLTPKRVE